MTEWIDLKERKPPYDPNDDGKEAIDVLAWFVGSQAGVGNSSDMLAAAIAANDKLGEAVSILLSDELFRTEPFCESLTLTYTDMVTELSRIAPEFVRWEVAKGSE